MPGTSEVATLTVLVEASEAWWPDVAGELFDPAGEFLWAAVADTEDGLSAMLTCKDGRARLLADRFPGGYRLEWRYPTLTRS